jgi:type III secretion protein T
MMMMPATPEQVIHGRIRISLILVLCAFIAWGQSSKEIKSLTGAALALLLFKEALIGLCLGYAAGAIFWVAEGVGSFIDNIAGYNSVQQSNPMSDAQSTPIGNISLQLVTSLFYGFGGMLVFIGLMYDTFRWWPLEKMAPMPGRLLEAFVMEQTDTIMTQIVKLASPCLICLALVDLGVGLITRTASKLEPNSLAQPIKASLALLLVALSFGIFVSQLRGEISLATLGARIERMLSVQEQPSR